MTEKEILIKPFNTIRTWRLVLVRPADLNKKPKQKTWYQTMREAVYSTTLHEGYHAGKIGTLRRFLGKPALFGYNLHSREILWRSLSFT